MMEFQQGDLAASKTQGALKRSRFSAPIRTYCNFSVFCHVVMACQPDINMLPRPFLPLVLLVIASIPALADPLGVTNTNGDASSGSLGAALNNAGADTGNSDSITFGSLFNNSQTIDLTGPYGTVSKSAGENLSLSAPTRLTISTSYGGFAFTGGGNFYLRNITIIGSTGPTNPDLS
jgi:hypothetical protein